MKRILWSLGLALVVFLWFSNTGFRVPGHVFDLDELDSAMERAVAEEKPLLFVVASPTTH